MTDPCEKPIRNRIERKGRLTIPFVVLALFASLAGVVASSPAAPNMTDVAASVWATVGWDDASALEGVDRRLGRVRTIQKHALSDGSGLLELSRGGEHLEMDGIALEGEQDIMGSPWIGFNQWVTKCWKEGKGKNSVTVCEDYPEKVDTLWDGGDWSGTSWSGTSWSGTSWSGTSWSGTSWSDKTSSGTSWSGTSWSGTSWSGRNWTGLSWG